MQDLSDLKTGLLEHGDLTGDRFAVTDSSRLGTGGGRGGGGGEEKIGALEQLRQRARWGKNIQYVVQCTFNLDK